MQKEKLAKNYTKHITINLSNLKLFLLIVGNYSCNMDNLLSMYWHVHGMVMPGGSEH